MAGGKTTLAVPTTVRPQTAYRDAPISGGYGDRLKRPFDHSAASSSPLAAAALHTAVRETEASFRRAPDLGARQEGGVHDEWLPEVTDPSVGLDHS